jgi:hypothetical protein
MTIKTFLVLFSCALFACLLGLNVSSAFKTAVAIYILIPLLLIPQILLCGVVIKFNDLKSARAGDNYVPVMGDLMASRWGLEALIVEQFGSNRYQRLFFAPDREISRAEFIANDLIPEVQAKLDFLFLKTELAEKEALRKRYARIVRHEIRYLEARTGNPSGLDDSRLALENLNRPRAAEITAYLQKTAQLAGDKKARALKQKQRTAEGLVSRYGQQGMEEFKRRHFNSGIANLGYNREELDTLRLSGERLVQLSDPVYQRAESPWGRAVFLGSEKRIWSLTFGTYFFNLAALWVMTAVLAAALHFRLLKRLLERSR